MRRRRKPRVAKLPFIPIQSKIEQDVGKIIKKLGYKYKEQVSIFSTRNRCRGIFDFLLECHSVAVEVNGTYWHSDPRAYPNGPKYKTQRKNIRAWNRKLDQAKRQGIRVLVLWEMDLKNADDMYVYVRDTIKQFIKQD